MHSRMGRSSRSQELAPGVQAAGGAPWAPACGCPAWSWGPSGHCLGDSWLDYPWWRLSGWPESEGNLWGKTTELVIGWYRGGGIKSWEWLLNLGDWRDAVWRVILKLGLMATEAPRIKFQTKISKKMGWGERTLFLPRLPTLLFPPFFIITYFGGFFVPGWLFCLGWC